MAVRGFLRVLTCVAFFDHTVLCKSNESEYRRNLTKLCDISKEANFRRYFNEESTQPLFRYYRNFVQMREISHGISFEISSGEAKFQATFRVGERNFL